MDQDPAKKVRIRLDPDLQPCLSVTVNPTLGSENIFPAELRKNCAIAQPSLLVEKKTVVATLMTIPITYVYGAPICYIDRYRIYSIFS